MLELLTTTEFNPEIRFLYNGQLGVVTDDNGLYYMRARYYNPEIKRFINQDILTGNIGNNKSLNRYSYVEGNPISYTDPFGLSPYKAMGHAVLDVIGIFWSGADIINAVWYFLEGEAEEGIKSLVYAIPGSDIYGTLTKFTTKGSKGYKIAATTEDIIIHGGYAGTIAFASYDTGKLGGDLFEKYFVDGAEVTGETAAEIATLLLTGTQLGFSIKNGISFNGKMYADDVLDMSGVKIVNNSVTKDFWNNNGGYVNIDAFKGGTSSGKYQVGAYQDIKGIEGLDAHHVGQKAIMKKFVAGYDELTAPAINVPKLGHTIRHPERGIVSRSTKDITNARQLLARDLFELKRVYPDIPKSSLRKLIDMNMEMYPEMRKY